MKTKNSGPGAGAMFIKRRAVEREQCHFCDGSVTLIASILLPHIEPSVLPSTRLLVRLVVFLLSILMQ